MSDKRQKTQQLQLAFMSESRGEAPMADVQGTEALTAKRFTESPADTEHLMEAICNRENLWKALKQVQANKGSGGMDGTPQGGPLSPVLSNLVLDELDRELGKRGHRFVRYADDCNIYVQSERAGQRVMASMEQFISRKLKLKVNAAKSAVARPWERKFLGFTFTSNRQPKRRIAPKALARFTQKVRDLTRRTRGISVETMVEQLSSYLRGWRSYFGFCQTPSVLEGLNSWVRRRIRCFQWKQWKRGRRRFAELVKRGVSRYSAAVTAGAAHGPWRISRCPALHQAMPDAYWMKLGLPRLLAR